MTCLAASSACCIHAAPEDGGSGSTSGTPSTTASSSGGTSSGYYGASGAGDGGGSNPDAGVLERNNDARRDGVYVDGAFKKAALPNTQLQSFTTAQPAGAVFAQPLYLANGAGGKATVYVVDERDDVYAFDAESGATLWHVTVGSPMPLSGFPCGGIDPLGITGTPIIDAASRTIFFDAMTALPDGGPPDGGNPLHVIEALSVDDGSTRWSLPVDSTVPGFSSSLQNQRAALSLLNGILYVPYGGFEGDCGAFRGYVVAVPLSDPTSAKAWVAATPIGGGIWEPSGLSSDGEWLYAGTGNAIADPSYLTVWANANSEGLLRLAPGNPPTFSGNGTDFFTPAEWTNDDESDLDLGSCGTVLFDHQGTPLAFAGGKTRNAYLLDRGALGGIGPGVDAIPGANSGGIFGSLAAYTTATATYVVTNSAGTWCSGDVATFTVTGDPPQLGQGWCGTQGGGGSPIVTTSNGVDDYVVWGLGSSSLTAFDGDTGAVLYTSPPLQGLQHWITPIVANGSLFVASNQQVYKLTP